MLINDKVGVGALPMRFVAAAVLMEEGRREGHHCLPEMSELSLNQTPTW